MKDTLKNSTALSFCSTLLSEYLSSPRYLHIQGKRRILNQCGTHATASQPPVLRKSYLWDPLEPVASRVLAQTLYNENGDYIEELYFCHDAQKNTTALFGILGGRRALYEYGAYGQPLKSEGNAVESNPFRYSSEYHDTELGLIYYNYRHYNPSDGRWLTRDPLGEEETRNLYRFVNNNPAFWGDALGLQRTIEEGVIQQQYYQDYSTVCINLCKNRITGILLSDLTKSSLGNIPSSQKTDELFGKASQSIASSWAQGFGFDITVQASISTNSTNILAREVALNITGKATYDLYNSQLKLGNDIMHLNAGPTPSKAQRQASVVTGVNFPVGINKNIRVTGEVKFQDGKVSEGIISFCVNIIF